MKKIAFIFLWILIFSIPWQNVVTFPGVGTITRMIGFGVVGLAGIYILVKKKLKEPSLFIILMGLFVAWSFISYFWSINPGATISRTVTNIQLLAMVWLIWELCDNRRNVLLIMQAYILGAYISLINMFNTFLTLPTGGIRIAATGFDPNYLATMLALGIPIAWYLFLQKQSGVLAWVNLLYVFLSIFGVILTASRGGMLVVIAASLIIPLTIFDLQVRTRLAVIGVLTIIIFASIFYMPDIYPRIERNIERFVGAPTEIREGTMANRRVIWNAGLQVHKEHPLLGVGAHGFRFAIQGMPVDPATGVRPGVFSSPRAPHNTYLSILVDTGLIGMGLFIAIFLIALIPVFYLTGIEIKFYLVLLLALFIGLIPIGWEYDKATWYILSLFTLQASFVIRNMKLNIILR